MMVGMTLLCWNDALKDMFSICCAWNDLFVLFMTKLSGGNLFGINMLFHDFHLSCGLLFMMLYSE
jgi:hypothetical protein